MSDLISRQDAIELLTSRVVACKGIYGDLGGAISGARELIKCMPSAEHTAKVTNIHEEYSLFLLMGIVIIAVHRLKKEITSAMSVAQNLTGVKND